MSLNIFGQISQKMEDQRGCPQPFFISNARFYYYFCFNEPHRNISPWQHLYQQQPLLAFPVFDTHPDVSGLPQQA